MDADSTTIVIFPKFLESREWGFPGKFFSSPLNIISGDILTHGILMCYCKTQSQESLSSVILCCLDLIPEELIFSKLP